VKRVCRRLADIGGEEVMGVPKTQAVKVIARGSRIAPFGSLMRVSKIIS
jgi:hypothetical protein